MMANDYNGTHMSIVLLAKRVSWNKSPENVRKRHWLKCPCLPLNQVWGTYLLSRAAWIVH